MSLLEGGQMGKPKEKEDVAERKCSAEGGSVAEMQQEEKSKKAGDTQDLVEKEFLAYPDVTEDVLNALLFHGEKVTDKENLLAGPTEIIYQGEKRLRTQYEDLCKYEILDGKIHLMYLIANQSRTDGKMLLRKAGYTGGIYREQYEGKRLEIFPVIEIVLYWGAPRWRSSRDFRRLFRKKEISEDKWKYIDELKLHIFEMRHLPEETRKLFQSDMRIVVDFLAEGKAYRSDRKIIHKAALIKMIKVLSGDMDIEAVEDWMKEQGLREDDEIMVCELFDQYERRGRTEGRLEGRREGRAEERNSIIRNMLQEGMDKELISRVTGCSLKELTVSAEQ